MEIGPAVLDLDARGRLALDGESTQVGMWSQSYGRPSGWRFESSPCHPGLQRVNRTLPSPRWEGSVLPGQAID